MVRKLCAIGLALVVGTLVFGQGGRIIPIDNFNDGDDDGWSYFDSTAGTPWGPATYDPTSGSYLLEAAGPVPAFDPNVGTIVATWEGSRDRRRFSNGSVRAKFRANAYGTTAGLVLRANDEDHTNYGFYGSTTFGTFYIERFDGSQASPQTIIAMADPEDAPFAAGEDWYMEAGVVGNNLWMKVWKVGDPEPARPLLRIRDRELGPGSGSLICVIAFFDPAAIEDPLVNISATFDDVTFSPGR
jgi:hypothetical protein